MLSSWQRFLIYSYCVWNINFIKLWSTQVTQHLCVHHPNSWMTGDVFCRKRNFRVLFWWWSVTFWECLKAFGVNELRYRYPAFPFPVSRVPNKPYNFIRFLWTLSPHENSCCYGLGHTEWCEFVQVSFSVWSGLYKPLWPQVFYTVVLGQLFGTSQQCEQQIFLMADQHLSNQLQKVCFLYL